MSMEKVKMQDRRNYETFVFKVTGLCDCGCGQPDRSGTEIYGIGCMNGESAREQHMETCHKVAEGKINVEENRDENTNSKQ